MKRLCKQQHAFKQWCGAGLGALQLALPLTSLPVASCNRSKTTLNTAVGAWLQLVRPRTKTLTPPCSSICVNESCNRSSSNDLREHVVPTCADFFCQQDLARVWRLPLKFIRCHDSMCSVLPRIPLRAAATFVPKTVRAETSQTGWDVKAAASHSSMSMLRLSATGTAC